MGIIIFHNQKMFICYIFSIYHRINKNKCRARLSWAKVNIRSTLLMILLQILQIYLLCKYFNLNMKSLFITNTRLKSTQRACFFQRKVKSKWTHWTCRVSKTRSQFLRYRYTVLCTQLVNRPSRASSDRYCKCWIVDR